MVIIQSSQALVVIVVNPFDLQSFCFCIIELLHRMCRAVLNQRRSIESGLRAYVLTRCDDDSRRAAKNESDKKTRTNRSKCCWVYFFSSFFFLSICSFYLRFLLIECIWLVDAASNKHSTELYSTIKSIENGNASEKSGITISAKLHTNLISQFKLAATALSTYVLRRKMLKTKVKSVNSVESRHNMTFPFSKLVGIWLTHLIWCNTNQVTV